MSLISTVRDWRHRIARKRKVAALVQTDMSTVERPVQPSVEQPAQPVIDYHLRELVPWLTRAEPLPQPLRTEALKPLYEAATRNLRRADGIVSSTALMIWGARQAHEQAAAQKAAQPGAAAPHGITYPEALTIGFDGWQAISADPNMQHIFGSAIMGGLSAYIVQAWTAFETLMSDLWEVTLNIHPATLTKLVGTNTGALGESDGKSVPLWMLQRHNYNLSGMMGTVLRAKFKFDSLEGIREAYKAAFGMRETEVLHAALAHDALRTANAIRQVIVHRGGVVDDEYLRRAAKLPLAPKVNVGSELPLDGKLVADLLTAAVPQVLQVLTFVDNWISPAEVEPDGDVPEA